MSIKVEGLAGIEQAMAAVGNRGAVKRAAQKALKEAAQPIAEMASYLAPKDENDLAGSIKVGKAIKGMKTRDKDVAETFVGIDESQDKRLRIYAKEQEFGNQARNMQAQPYMRPAWDTEGPKTVERIAEPLWREIGKAGERAAKKRAKAGG